MTTPDERRRNLIWGRETLEELSADTGLREEWRHGAATLLAAYPAGGFLREFDGTDLQALDPYTGVLFKVRMLFIRVLASKECPEQRRYSLRVVLRHLP